MKKLIEKFTAFEKELNKEYKKSIEVEDSDNTPFEDIQGALIIIKEEQMPEIKKQISFLNKKIK